MVMIWECCLWSTWNGWCGLRYGVSLRSCGQFSPHILVPSHHVVCHRGPVPIVDLDDLCVKEGGRN